MTQAAAKHEISPTPRQAIPPLENGAHLTRPEFERRFDATPELKKAELIDGVVYMAPPPVSHDFHGVPHFRLITALGTYEVSTPGVAGGDNSSIRLDLDNMPQPDIYLIVEPPCGGQAKIDAEGYVEGAPEFVCEVAATSASLDLHRKLDLYRRHGVKEYVVWRTLDGEIDYFVARQGQYVKLDPQPSGEYRSETLPGLWLDAPAVLKGDWMSVMRKIQEGISSTEHTAFVDQLKRKREAK